MSSIDSASSVRSTTASSSSLQDSFCDSERPSPSSQPPMSSPLLSPERVSFPQSQKGVICTVNIDGKQYIARLIDLSVDTTNGADNGIDMQDPIAQALATTHLSSLIKKGLENSNGLTAAELLIKLDGQVCNKKAANAPVYTFDIHNPNLTEIKKAVEGTNPALTITPQTALAQIPSNQSQTIAIQLEPNYYETLEKTKKYTEDFFGKVFQPYLEHVTTPGSNLTTNDTVNASNYKKGSQEYRTFFKLTNDEYFIAWIKNHLENNKDKEKLKGILSTQHNNSENSSAYDKLIRLTKPDEASNEISLAEAEANADADDFYSCSAAGATTTAVNPVVHPAAGVGSGSDI